MTEHGSYHDGLTGEQAVQRLRSSGRNGYLTRFSEAQNIHVLTVFKQQTPNDVIKHFKISLENGKCKINNEIEFMGIEELLEYYEKNRIDPVLRTIGEKYTLNE